MDAGHLLAMARRGAKHKPSENVFAEVADWLRSEPPHVEVSERINMIHRLLCSRTDQAIDLYEELLNWEMLNDPAEALQTMSYLYVITRSEGYKVPVAQGLCIYASSEGANMQYVLNNLLLVGEYGGLDLVDEVIKEVEVTCPTTSW
jgi:hypothetical protein